MSTSVVFKNVTKTYKMYKNRLEKMMDLALPNDYGKKFYALKNINFQAEPGDIIGIIGINGAGKSTMSNLLAGVIPPNKGDVEIDGEAALISIGAGLNNNLTGRENIELKCLMLGFSKKKIQDLMPEIIEFADIGDFIDQPVKSFSSGMKSRLGFSISVNIDPDILIIDEALSVGDKTFAQKSLDRMNEFKARGKTIFFISHSIGQVKEFCTKAIWLEAGEIKQYGPVEEVTSQYEQFIREFNKMSPEEKKQFNLKNMEKRTGAFDVVKNELSISRKESKRKKTKRGKLKYLLFIMILFLCGFTYIKWNGFFHNENNVVIAKPDNLKLAKKEQIAKAGELVVNKPKQVAKETSAQITKDVRYVQVSTGYVRNKPDLNNSKKLTFLSFGDVINVEGIQKDPVETDLNWLKITLKDGQEGWISESLVSKVSKVIGESSFVEKVNSIALINNLQKAIEYLDNQDKSLEQNSKLNLDIESQTATQIINKFGEPALSEGQHSLMYHGSNNDYIFYSSYSKFYNKLTIKPVVK